VTRPLEHVLSPEVLALLDHLAEELAAEYMRLLTPHHGMPREPNRPREGKVER
jgi:hypothetical protein